MLFGTVAGVQEALRLDTKGKSLLCNFLTFKINTAAMEQAGHESAGQWEAFGGRPSGCLSLSLSLSLCLSLSLSHTHSRDLTQRPAWRLKLSCRVTLSEAHRAPCSQLARLSGGGGGDTPSVLPGCSED